MRERLVVEMGGLFGGAMWWEKGSPDVDVNGWKRQCEGFEVRYPLRLGGKKKEGMDRMKRRREGLRLPRKLEPEEADRPEQLVHIRLEFDVGHRKLRDTFVWNLNDPVITPEVFAQSIVDDYALAPSYHSVIVKSIQEQLTDYRAHSLNYDQDFSVAVVGTPVLQGTLDGSCAQWGTWRTRMKTTTSWTTTTGAGRSRNKRKRAPDAMVKSEEKNVVDFDVNDEDFARPMAIDEIKLDEGLMQEEMRILIRLNIIVGAKELEDQFEWDLMSGTITPEEFSEKYIQDLNLGGEFKTAVAHSIREQVQMYRKLLFLVGHHSDSTPIQDEELRQAFLPSLTAGARPIDHVPSYAPMLRTVNDSDIERREKKHEKVTNKRRKRNQRGRSGIIIPGREPFRTHRTPANGFPGIDSATLAPMAPANGVGSRRAAAAAASLMITNMIALENDTADIPPPSTVLKLQLTKEKYLLKVPTPSLPVPAPLESGPPPPPPSLEPKMRVMLKNPAKELEREAMEKEFTDGQFPNWIGGIWHCSNCGCPKSMTFVRRSGPLGEKSLCGFCGKFWHKHRRPRPVEYNPDPEFHTRQGSNSKTPVQYKAQTLRAQRMTGRPPGQVHRATTGPSHSPTTVQLPSTLGGEPPSPNAGEGPGGGMGGSGMVNGSKGIGSGGGGGMNMNVMAINPAAVGGAAGGINPAASPHPGNAGFNPMAKSHQQHPSLPRRQQQGAPPTSMQQQPQQQMPSRLQQQISSRQQQPMRLQQQISSQQQQPMRLQHLLALQWPQLSPQQQAAMNQQQQEQLMFNNVLGMTREQFFSLGQQERQQAWMKLVHQMLPPGGYEPQPD